MSDVTPRPTCNARGKPWTSRGHRNLACAGTGRGNGGVSPPGTYLRRRNIVGNGRHDNRWRTDWTKVVSFLLTEARISATDAAVALALAWFSNDVAQHVWPSQTTIGARCGRSASVVNRSLAHLRALGMLEWEHRFLGPSAERPTPSATSNMYEFLIPRGLLDEIGIRKRTASHARKARHSRTNGAAPSSKPVDHRRSQAQSAGASRAHTGLAHEQALAEIEEQFPGDEQLQLLAMEEYTEVLRRNRGT